MAGEGGHWSFPLLERLPECLPQRKPQERRGQLHQLLLVLGIHPVCLDDAALVWQHRVGRVPHDQLHGYARGAALAADVQVELKTDVTDGRVVRHVRVAAGQSGAQLADLATARRVGLHLGGHGVNQARQLEGTARQEATGVEADQQQKWRRVECQHSIRI